MPMEPCAYHLWEMRFDCVGCEAKLIRVKPRPLCTSKKARAFELAGAVGDCEGSRFIAFETIRSPHAVG
jgi:hypothetical protein